MSDKSSRKRVKPVKQSEIQPSSAAFPIVGVGASAGGLEAFTSLLNHFPPDSGMALVLVQHLDPHHESALTDILSRATKLPVITVTHKLRVEPNRIYVIPPNTNMSIVQGVLKLEKRLEGRTANYSINFFLESLAQDQGGRAIGVILSGSAMDGTVGLEAIKAEGGITFAQDESAKYDSMPRSAVNAGCVDFVLSPQRIASELMRISRHPYIKNAKGESDSNHDLEDGRGGNGKPVHSGHKWEKNTNVEISDEALNGVLADPNFKNILLLLSNHRGVDFTLYKPSTIQRRIARRVVLNKLETLREYAQFLRGNGKELEMLFSDVLINVTSFFRNPEAFEALKNKVFPQYNQKHHDDPLRVWVAGCSTGQEAYSIAMAFLEYSDQTGSRPRIQVFATDLNDQLLDKARRGLYPKSLVLDLSPQRLRRFFIQEDGGYRIIKSVREMCVFAPHNLISNPPFSRMDLISCRNVMIYLDQKVQKKIFPIFHYALKPTGFLFLGSSESVSQFKNLFEPADLKQRLYSRKIGGASAQVLNYPSKHAGMQPVPIASRKDKPPQGIPAEQNAQREADRIAINLYAPPGVLVDASLQIIQFRGDTSAYLVPPKGKARFDLLKMAREGLMLPLRDALNKVKKENKTFRKNLRLARADHTVNIEVIPLKNIKERCYLVMFQKAPLGQNLRGSTSNKAKMLPDGDMDSGRQPESKSKKHESLSLIAELELELTEARDYSQSVEEQYEATNEALQASGEEIQSANEELQSINEELETSKEEIESNNEELTTVNEEMTHRNAELSSLNSDLNNFHLSVNMAFVLLARDLTIRRFTSQAMKVFNLLDSDVGRSFGNIKHNLDCPNLEQMLAEVIDTVSVRECEVRDNSGRWFSLRVRPYMTQENVIDGAVLVLVDIDVSKKNDEAQRLSEIRYRRLFEAAHDGIIIIDPKTRKITEVNPYLIEFMGYKQQELVGKELFEIGLLKDEKANQIVFEKLKDKGSIRYDNLPLQTKGGERREVEFVSNLYRENGHDVIQCNVRDITERKRAQDAMNFLSGATAVMLSSLEYKKTLTALTALAVPKLADWAFIDLVQDNTMVRLAVAHSDPTLEKLAAKIMKFPLDTSSHEHLPAQVFQSGKSLLIRDFNEDVMMRKFAQSPEHAKVVQEIDPKSLMLIPLVVRQKVLGVLVMAVCGSRRYGIEDLILAEELARRAATAIENARLYKESEEAASKLAQADHEKDEYMAMLAHELRNPLAPIHMAAEIIRISKSENPDINKAQEIIQRQANHMIRLIDDLMDTSRLQHRKVSIRMEHLDLAKLILNSLDACRPSIESQQHTVALDLTNDPILYVNADPVRLEQIVCNLIINAAKYTPQKGAIHISAKREENMAVIRVKDNGIGIEQHMLTQIFNPFTQVNHSLERKGGLGLGLKLAQELVAMQGGTVEARSEGLGMGSEFIVRLPAVVRSISKTLPVVEKTEPSTGKRILLIDDNTDVLESMSMLLKLAGHSVEVTDDGQKGLDKVFHAHFDVAIVDVGLPTLSGYEIAKRIRAHPNGAKIILIALTGYGQAKDRQLALDAGFNEHLTKPVDPQVLMKLFNPL